MINGLVFIEMPRLSENHANSYNLDNCFGFNENDINLLLWEKSSVVNETNAPLEFQPNKPYRLALYVKPSEPKRLQKTKSFVVKNPFQKPKDPKNNESINNTQSSVISEKNNNKRSTRKKKVNISLFDENTKPENLPKKIKITPEKANISKNVSIENSSCKNNVLKEVNVKPLSRGKQSKVRRSYERKFKEKEETENVPEPPSEQIIKELEFKKLSRTKQKKVPKDEQEFEKWANNMNSAFDDVEKFELSITYD